MVSVWIQSLHNLHCPTCGARLVQQAGRYEVPERPRPVYVGEVATLCCTAGHPVPPRQELYDQRERWGLPRSAPAYEVPPPFTTAER